MPFSQCADFKIGVRLTDRSIALVCGARPLTENAMSDDKTKRSARDRARINVNQAYEARDWAKSLGVDEHELRNAVSVVGDNAEKVREYLKSRTQRKGPHRAGYLGRRKAGRRV